MLYDTDRVLSTSKLTFKYEPQRVNIAVCRCRDEAMMVPELALVTRGQAQPIIGLGHRYCRDTLTASYNCVTNTSRGTACMSLRELPGHCSPLCCCQCQPAAQLLNFGDVAAFLGSAAAWNCNLHRALGAPAASTVTWPEEVVRRRRLMKTGSRPRLW